MASTQSINSSADQAQWDFAIHTFWTLYVDNNSKPMVFCQSGDGIVATSDDTPNLTVEEVRTGWSVTVALYQHLMKALEKPSGTTEAPEASAATDSTDSTDSYPIFGYGSVAEYFASLRQFYESASGPVEGDHDAFKAVGKLDAVLGMFEYEPSLEDEEADEEAEEDYQEMLMRLQERVRRSIRTVIRSVDEASDKDAALASILSLQDTTFFTESMLMEAAAHTYIACAELCAKVEQDPAEAFNLSLALSFTGSILGRVPDEIKWLGPWLLSQASKQVDNEEDDQLVA